MVLGKAPTAAAVPAEVPALLVEKGQLAAITSEVTLDESVTAPVSGQRLGTLTIRAGDRVLREVPLVAETAVTRKGWGDIFVDILRTVAMAKQDA